LTRFEEGRPRQCPGPFGTASLATRCGAPNEPSNANHPQAAEDDQGLLRLSAKEHLRRTDWAAIWISTRRQEVLRARPKQPQNGSGTTPKPRGKMPEEDGQYPPHDFPIVRRPSRLGHRFELARKTGKWMRGACCARAAATASPECRRASSPRRCVEIAEVGR